MAEDRSALFDSRVLLDRVKAEALPPLVRVYLAPPEEVAAWEVIESAVDMIAGHYRLERDDVWSAVIQLEIEMHTDTGEANFGRLLERPIGFASLGLSVAHEFMDHAEANAIPLICLNYH